MAEIVVAWPKLGEAKVIKNILIKNGYSCLGIETSGSKAISLADSLGGGILISAYSFEDMIYSDIRENLSDRFDMLLICNPGRITEGLDEGIIFLPLPLKVHELCDTLSMIEDTRARKRKLRRNAKPVRSEEDVKAISMAKALLMDRNHMSEDEAHRYLQKTSMSNGCNLVETARMVISLKRL